MKLRLVSTWNLLLQLLLLLGAVGAYTSPETTTSRRRLFQSVGAAVGVVAAAAPAQANQYCASGVGEGCADLSEGNDLIRSLQEKSAANREKNEREAREAFYMKNYPDFFATLDKTLVKKADGTFFVVDAKELAVLKRENRLSYDMPKAMGGKVTDVTQKPILVLKE